MPPRIHLDLHAQDQAAEVKRLLALGATEVHWSKRPPDADDVILADPEAPAFVSWTPPGSHGVGALPAVQQRRHAAAAIGRVRRS